MYTRILTETERNQIDEYVSKDGERTSSMRAMVTRARQNMPTIEEDLKKLRRLLKSYEKSRRAGRRG
ncbi:MAG: hypothetical protein ABSF82_00655 [Candidatus Bathyarchaeia archaeon]|jgi:hypothetical protein